MGVGNADVPAAAGALASSAFPIPLQTVTVREPWRAAPSLSQSGPPPGPVHAATQLPVRPGLPENSDRHDPDSLSLPSCRSELGARDGPAPDSARDAAASR
jgi:hypothetical protein